MARMKAPESGVRIRMYRQGQGDCFLLAFPRKGGTANNPVYLLIDCGIMNGSGIEDIEFAEVIDHIADATGGRIDYVAITHEHADHVNGFNRKRRGKRLFDQITFGHLWLAWTEEDEPFANSLRERFRDTLVALAMAEQRMDGVQTMGAARRDLGQLLELEIGDRAERAAFAASLGADGTGAFAAIEGITNKRAIKYLRDTAETGPEFLRPGQTPFEIDGTTGARVYVLGPPRNVEQLLSLDPQGQEEFHAAARMGLDGEAAAFHMAMTGGGRPGGASPFGTAHARPAAEVLDTTGPAPDGADQQVETYAAAVYSQTPDQDWRRIDGDWLGTASRLALRLNDEVNNTSLVLAFELPETGKVLLFSGDAQRGNWISWSDITWNGDAGPVTSRELLGRCVFYKCGHHGSHNATLDGRADDDYANLAWLGRGEFAKDFMAMIPVHSEWANQSQNWNHPLPAIDHALRVKARGRVLRADTRRVRRPDGQDGMPRLTDEEWQSFKDLSIEGRLYKELIIEDKA